MKRRPDRLEEFFRNTSLVPSEVQVVDAFDGKSLVWSEGLRQVFRDNKFGNRRAIAGCALSHFLLWRHIASTTGEYHLVFEDDARLTANIKNFTEEWNSKYYHSYPIRSPLVYLGGLKGQNLDVYESGEVIKSISRTFVEHLPNQYFAHTFDEGLDSGKEVVLVCHSMY